MELDLYQVDAFAARPFEGNPAAVCPIPVGADWPADDVLQGIALENNLSETAYFQREGDAYRLRWFTPGTEVDLCGHATLATAWTLFHLLGHEGDAIGFDTRSGRLTVRRDGDMLAMDFPATPVEPMIAVPNDLKAALGGDPSTALNGAGGNGYVMAVYRTAAEVAALKPDMSALAALSHGAVIATAPSDGAYDGYDFVSRMFAPAKGVPEDPVTGSAHCVLAPYWAGRLGKKALKARQISARGGDVGCQVDGDRVHLTGQAVLYMTGKLSI